MRLSEKGMMAIAEKFYAWWQKKDQPTVKRDDVCVLLGLQTVRLAVALFNIPDYPGSKVEFRKALELFDMIGMSDAECQQTAATSRAHILICLGIIAAQEGDAEKAIELIEEGANMQMQGLKEEELIENASIELMLTALREGRVDEFDFSGQLN